MSAKISKNAGRSFRNGFVKGIEAALTVAREREAICADAVRLVEAGDLYAGVPTALASENCARLEAAHIAHLIAKLKDTRP